MSFIENARRAQIIANTIELIASEGYSSASLANIARRAGISKGIISYYFGGKDALIQEVARDIFNRCEAYMRPRIEAESSFAEQLRVYIESNIAFMKSHPSEIVALVEIMANHRLGTHSADYLLRWYENTIGGLERQLREGQAAGEFRQFSTQIMSVTIRSAIDALSGQLAGGGELDFDAYARELAGIFDHATRSGSGRSGSKPRAAET